MKVTTWLGDGKVSVQTNDPKLKRELHWLVYGKAYKPTCPDEYLVIRSDKNIDKIMRLINGL